MDFESICPHAQHFSQFPTNANAYSNFVIRLHLINDLKVLRELAQLFLLSPAVAVLVWRRFGVLSNNDPQGLLEAASAMYSNGIDEEAIRLLNVALELDEKYIPALELKAALTADGAERKLIFERILKIEPGNRRAVENLIMLGQHSK